MDVAVLEPQYGRVARAMRTQFERSAFWADLVPLLADLRSEYFLETGFALSTTEPPVLIEKTWASFWLKTYRRNVTENPRWPRAPKGGWLTPDRWHAVVGDVIRCRIVVRYLDGVTTVTDGIDQLARRTRNRCDVALEARDEGYYAAHVSIWHRFELPKAAFDTETIRARVEIQVTTQVKDVVQDLLHKQYQDRRQLVQEPDEIWQWDYLSEAFRAGYLGHLAHYLEGLIMDLRDRGRS